MTEDVLVMLVPIIAIVLGSLVVLIPVAGLTARFALKPVLEALARYRELQGEGQKVHLLEQRLALLEEQMHSHDRSLSRVLEDADFRRKLEAPPGQF
ncbi:MAG: hypothetical protein M3409_08075 [Gemmatimonadota bacterium]|jgi:hypothetical protein|nr:hypothetical protein [Gemmatimonadota bacterium]